MTVCLFFGVVAGQLCEPALGVPPASSKPASQQSAAVLDGAARLALVVTAAKALEAGYYSPAMGRRMATHIEENRQRGKYDRLTQGADFARQLTDDLQAVAQDKHVALVFERGGFAGQSAPHNTPALDVLAFENYGIAAAERLDGNVGYLKIDYFLEAERTSPVLAAAMTFLARTDALIIDLRDSGGGDSRAVASVVSYLVEGGPLPVNTFDIRWDSPIVRRKADKICQMATTWTTVVPERYGAAKPVFVLTSTYTFSASEEFAYALQALKRATVVGAVTRGAANPGGLEVLNADFALFVPWGRAVNPITKTNWEGIGVQPHLKVAGKRAFAVAYERALGAVARAADHPQKKEQLAEAIARRASVERKACH
ncbi:S41 family peptidase [Gloeobacter morelensis MG652769]|uniref:S41 family peptidase n=2 Tax=Gloeobacter TaxID=33071 RepID=A0ABY3PRT4_9CYAN|nr:S41 family peptidase [Gloeobacter morelensis]UFP96243.1 S41 family peptidase [Gloeobacter morelensis MG652769]